MASTVFKVVSWSPNDPITDDKLGAMIDNDTYLRDNMVRARYNANGVIKTTGVKIASGLALISSGKSAQFTRNVTFGSYFQTGCRPIITTGTVAGSQRQIWVTVDGPGSLLLPTRDGFQVHVFVNSASKTKKIARNFYVAWHALGY